MKGFPGVYVCDGQYTATCHYDGNKYHLGVYDSPEKASLKIKLFKLWLNRGYTLDQIPRLWNPLLIKYKPVRRVPYELLQRIIITKGNIQITNEDLADIASELQTLRVSKYGSAKSLKM